MMFAGVEDPAASLSSYDAHFYLHLRLEAAPGQGVRWWRGGVAEI